MTGPAADTIADACRLTVVGPARRVDLAVPATVPLGEMLPWLLRHALDEDDLGEPWILQRLGEEPLDPESTPETAGLRHGDVLYLRTESAALPAAEFDDVAVGVASALSERGGMWRPSFTGRLLLGLACLALAAFVVGALAARPWWRAPAYLGFGAVELGVGCALMSRRRTDTAIRLVGGLGSCAFAALAGLSAERGLPGIIAPGREEVLVAGSCAAVVAAALLAALPRALRAGEGTPGPVLGAVLATALATVAGAGLALVTHWNATRATALLAVAIFVAGGRSVRLVLRAVGLRVPYLPRDAEELQQDIDPEPADRVARRTATALAWLDSLMAASAAIFAVAFIQLLRDPRDTGWTGSALAALLAAAVLLRARGLASLWQRVCLVVSAASGLAALVLALGLAGGPVPLAAASLLLLAVAGALISAAGRPPGARLLPIWGHAADLLETATTLALVPVLLLLLHVYAYARNLTG